MARDYVITVNSTVDVPYEWLEQRGVSVVPLKYTIDNETYEDMFGLTGKEFFAKLRAGKMAVTSQVTPEQAIEHLEPIIKDGKDVLHLAVSSALSGTCNSMRIAAKILKEKYPEAKVYIVDTLCACLGEAVLLYYVLKQKKAGRTIEEVRDWAEENKLHVFHNVTVDDLFHLHRGGRVSKTTAIVGSIVKIKPILLLDNDGTLKVIGKERGRKRSIQKIVDMSAELAKGWDNEIIMITHGDCPEDAEYCARLVREKIGVDNILINNIGTVIGGHTGPGVLAVFGMGDHR